MIAVGAFVTTIGMASPKRTMPADETALDQWGRLFKTVAHAHRLQILQLLPGDQYTVGELAEACGIPSRMASEDLRLTRRCGLLAWCNEDRKVYGQVAQPRLATNIIESVKARKMYPAN
jgi:DNA-binding transcriptional ArsR family regulator